MTEPTHELVVDAGTEAAVYRPVSGLAIAGFGLAVLCALIVSGIGLVAFLTGAPFLFPGLLLIALAGGILSGVGLARIARSEGTRAGRGLALWGLMLSLLFGLGYGAYIIATEIAVRMQAEKFTTEWFNLLRDGDVDREYLRSQLRIPAEVAGKVKSVGAGPGELVITDDDGKDWTFRDSEISRILRGENDARIADLKPGEAVSVVPRELKLDQETKFRAAFLLSIDPAQRQSDSPHNYRRLKARYFFDQEGGQGFLPSFMTRPVIQVLVQAGADAQIESLGARSWTYVVGPSGGYQVELVFRITTPEGRHTLIVPVQGSESKRGEFAGRQWRVLVPSIQPREQYLATPLGDYLRGLHTDSLKMVRNWGRAVERREVDQVHLQTLPPSRQLEHGVRLAGAGLAAGTGPGALAVTASQVGSPRLRRELFIQDYQLFPKPGFVRDEDLYANSEDAQEKVPVLIKEFLRGEAAGESLQVQVSEDSSQGGYSIIPSAHPWKLEGNELRLRHPVEFRLANKYRCDAVVEIATTDAAVVAKVRSLLEAGGGEPSSGKSVNRMGSLGGRHFGWQIVRLLLIDAASPKRGGQGQPQAPPGQPATRPGAMGPGGGLTPPGGEVAPVRKQ